MMEAISYHKENLNILKFFALLGIVLMNVEFFYTPLEAVGWGVVATPHWLAKVVHIFVHGKFWTIFSLVFGSTLFWAVRRGMTQEQKKASIISLGVLGILHSTLWAGDILFAYAMAASLLFLIINQKIAKISFLCIGIAILGMWLQYSSFGWILVGIICGVGCLYLGLYKKDMLVPSLAFWAFTPALMIAASLGGIIDPANEIVLEAKKIYQTQAEALQTLSFWDNFWMNFSIFFSKIFEQSFQILSILGVMGIGWVFAEKQIWERSTSWFLKHALWGFPLTLLGVLLAPPFEGDQAKFSLYQGFFEIGRLGVALFWVGIVWSFVRSSKWADAKKHMARVGANSLSVYLTQTLLGVFLFQFLLRNETINYPFALVIGLGIFAASVFLVFALTRTKTRGPFELLRKKIALHFLAKQQKK